MRPSQVNFRPARPEDADQLSDLLRQLTYPTSEAQIVSRLADLARAGALALVAVVDGKVVGLVTAQTNSVLHRSGDNMRITSLVVAESTRGLGLGRRLVAEVERRAREAGCLRMEVTSGNARHEAHEFYRHLGYPHTSLRFSKELN